VDNTRTTYCILARIQYAYGVHCSTHNRTPPGGKSKKPRKTGTDFFIIIKRQWVHGTALLVPPMLQSRNAIMKYTGWSRINNDLKQSINTMGRTDRIKPTCSVKNTIGEGITTKLCGWTRLHCCKAFVVRWKGNTTECVKKKAMVTFRTTEVQCKHETIISSTCKNSRTT
jgi:hypothetical protein